MGEQDWVAFKSELGETSRGWQALGPLVADYNACLDDLAAGAASSGREQELGARRERLRQGLVREVEHFTRLLAVLDAHLGTTTPAPDLDAATPAPSAAQAAQAAAPSTPEPAATDAETRGRVRGRARTPQPAVRQTRHDAAGLGAGVPLAAGAQVAALVDKQWIVANVETYDDARRRYRVRDPEPMEGKNDLFWVPAPHVLALYDWEHDPGAPTYAPGTRVLAVWPESTELYPGTVIEAPYRGPVCVPSFPFCCCCSS